MQFNVWSKGFSIRQFYTRMIVTPIDFWNYLKAGHGVILIFNSYFNISSNLLTICKDNWFSNHLQKTGYLINFIHTYSKEKP